MNTITLWLLIAALGAGYDNRQPVVIERFATEQDCKATARLLDRTPSGIPAIHTMCVEARVYRP